MRTTASPRRTSKLSRRFWGLGSFFELIVTCMVFVTAGGCNDKESTKPPTTETEAPANMQEQAPPVRLLTPDQGEGAMGDPLHTVDLSGQERTQPSRAFIGPPSQSPCPPEMVFVAGTFCIDRYEASLVDSGTSRSLSPHYPPSPDKVGDLFSYWTGKAPLSRRAQGRELPVPEPPAFQLTERFAPEARSVPGVLPSGYLSQKSAELSCLAAAKRLCTRLEWVTACRGQAGSRYPYGNTYQHGVCNVHRDSHPAALLHGNSSKNHTDPRLGLAADDVGPLLRRTGETPECASRWGQDAAMDMVGNLDEWVSDPEGVFLGGFYSRATRDGCDSFIDTHAPSYYDYSLGTRCCQDP